MVALGNDDVWLQVGQALVHTRPPPDDPRTIDFEQEQQLPADLHEQKLASEHCRDVFVQFFAVSRSAPKDFDYPELQKALGASSELGKLDLIEAEDNGARYVGARVESLEQGNALAKLAQKSVPGAKPSVLCANPKSARQLTRNGGLARRD